MKLLNVKQEKILIQIGSFVVCYSTLESNVRTLLEAFFKGHQRITQLISAELQFKVLRPLICSLYKEIFREDDDFKMLQGLMARAGKTEELRNQIMHSDLHLPIMNQDYLMRMKITAKGKCGRKVVVEEFDEKKLNEMVLEIEILAKDITSFTMRLVLSGKLSNNRVD